MKKGVLIKRHIGKYLLGIVVILLVILMVFEKAYVKKDKANPLSDTSTNVAFPYRTINALDSSQYLIAYEFHKGHGEDSRYLECSAVIKKLEPAKDDYKTICRSVFTDIVKTTGTDNIEVCIYDNYEAYELSELKYRQQFKVLNKSETDTVERHTVATYYGKMRGGEYQNNHTIWFYAEVHNRYTEKEVFEP